MRKRTWAGKQITKINKWDKGDKKQTYIAPREGWPWCLHLRAYRKPVPTPQPGTSTGEWGWARRAARGGSQRHLQGKLWQLPTLPTKSWSSGLYIPELSGELQWPMNKTGAEAWENKNRNPKGSFNGNTSVEKEIMKNTPLEQKGTLWGKKANLSCPEILTFILTHFYKDYKFLETQCTLNRKNIMNIFNNPLEGRKKKCGELNFNPLNHLMGGFGKRPKFFICMFFYSWIKSCTIFNYHDYNYQ